MIPPLYNHQKKIIAENKLKCGLFLGTGASKTRTALVMAEGSTLVICPKQQRDDRMWFNENDKWETKVDLTVISKEDLRKSWEELPRYDTVICDEVHTMIGMTPDTRMKRGIEEPRTSQIFESLYDYLNKFPPKRLYLLSATPVSKPLHAFALGLLLKKW